MRKNDRISGLLERMSLDEKIRLLCGKDNNHTADFPEYGIPSVEMADGPCGLRKQTGEGDHLGIADSIPAAAAVSGGCLAATWNPDCAYENGKMMGEEAAAAGVDLLLAPAMNIVRSPLCGRNFEYFSEDPFLTGKIAAAYTEGVQAAGVGACLKHFAGNNQETEREFVDAVIDERTLREVYLPGFEEAVKSAKPAAVMTALNKVNGEYGAQQKHLLTDILRKEWKFDGITVSDWYGVTCQEKALLAGLDLEMPYNGEAGAERIKKALETGRITMAEIDRACRNILNMISCIEQKREERELSDSDKMPDRHHEICRKIALEGIVLLKNEEGVLPLHEDDGVAVIGSYALRPKYTQEGSVRVVSDHVDIPLEKLREYSENIYWAEGFRADGNVPDCELEEEALRAAEKADKVVFFMGQADGVEREGKDRTDLSMPAEQVSLLEEILKVNKNVIVVLLNASPVEMPWSGRVKGIFECFLAGQGFGKAIADLLYGKVNPSGKLPVSFTRSLEDTSAYLFFPGEGEKVEYSEGVFCGYRYYDKRKTELLFPFGHGLSYTSFEYNSLEIRKENEKQNILRVTVKIKNSGDNAGAETVQLYVGLFDDKVLRPEKELKRFKKVFLKPEECKTVQFTLQERDFAYYDTDYQTWYMPEGEYHILIGASSRDIRLSGTVRMKPKCPRLAPLTGWSSMGQLKETPAGERYYRKIRAVLEEHLPENSPLFPREGLRDEDKLDKMPLRFVNLLSGGTVDGDTLMDWLKKVNIERAFSYKENVKKESGQGENNNDK